MKGMNKNTKENEWLVFDAEGCVVGRLAAFVAKQALLGKKIAVVNCEKAIISGKKENILNKYLTLRRKGRGWQKGPYWPSTADKLLRRIIRGMLPWKKARGKEAFKRVHCYKGFPKELEGMPSLTSPSDYEKTLKKQFLNFITLGELENLLRGGKCK
ncbi:MAG: 50S ribosomal protein L13 [Candidatus Pacearchaeota archaeon]